MKTASAMPNSYSSARSSGTPAAGRRGQGKQSVPAESAEEAKAFRGQRARPADRAAMAAPFGSTAASQQDQHTFRLLIESMHEGAVTMDADGTILFANESFAKMVKCPLSEVVRGSVFRFFSAADQAALAPLLRRQTGADAQLLVSLLAIDGSWVSTHTWIRPLAVKDDQSRVVGMVITDISDADADEELLRNLTHRVVQAYEAERGHVALELHQRITQMLCGILFRCQKLARQLPDHQSAARAEALKITEMLGETAEEVERISRNLRPSVLDNLGLVAALGATHAEFVARTGISLKVSLTALTVPLSPDADIALFRIHQEALKNVERHAGANEVTVELTQLNDSVCLTIQDDGTGFAPELAPNADKKAIGMGIFSMRERAAAVGGVLKIESKHGKGTLIEAQIPSTNRITP